MNTFKIIKTTILITVLTILAGCSEEITSPVTAGKNQDRGNPEVQENLSTNVYHSKFTLYPHESYSFGYENTGFYSFNSISVPNCEEIKDGIEVTGYLDDEALLLECSSKGFWVSSIMITNITGNKSEIDIYLTGSKSKFQGHKRIILNSE